MLTQNSPTPNINPALSSELARLLRQNHAEIATTWSQQIYIQASIHPEDQWLSKMKCTAERGLDALISILSHDSYDIMHTYLREVCEFALRHGVENGEVTASLLLCKDAMMPVVIREYEADMMLAFGLISAVDASLMWSVQHFNELYNAEIREQICEQQKQIGSMLQMGQEATSRPGFNEILNYMAEGMINVLHINHCDFYVVSDETSLLMPKVGVNRTPLDQMRQALFLNYAPDTNDDPLYRSILDEKQLVVCDDFLADPRVNQEINLMMDTKSFLAVPLVTHGKVLAIAITGTFGRYRSFTQEQIQMAENIASTAALVIENTQMYEKARYTAMLEERERLAREIHDNLAQALSIVKLQTSHIDTLLKNDDKEQAQYFLGEMKSIVVEAHQDARDAIFSLRSSSTATQGLLERLQSYLDRYHEHYGLNTHLLPPDDLSISLPAETIVQLTRILQEALANVRKHAAAKNVWVRLQQKENALHINIQDDGQGFDPRKLDAGEGDHVGLQVMRERAEGLGGSLQIETIPGDGTTVTIFVPLRAATDSQS